MRKDDKRITVRLDDELYRRFSSYARANGMTDSDAARTLLAMGLAGDDPVAKAALSIQSSFTHQISRYTAELTKGVNATLRKLLPQGTL